MKNALKHLQSLVAVALCVVMAMAFTSCSDDNDEPDNNSIVGTWVLALPDDGGMWYCQYCFKSNGTLDVKDWSSISGEPCDYEATGTWSILGDTISITIYEEDDSEPYTEIYHFTIMDNTLIIYDYEDPGPNVFVRR